MLALQFVTLSDSVEASNCLSASGETAVKLCKSELARSPGNLNAIMAMSEALISLRKYADAVKILKDGLARNPRNSDIKRKLALAQSYVEEKSFIERRRADAKLDAMTKRNVIRCKALSGESALEACNEALELKHSDPALYSAKGDVLLDMGRYVESILAYRKALRLAPEDTEVSAKLKTAALKRKNLVNTCKNDSGAAALSACDAALLNGEPDQFIIQKKKAELLLAMGRKQESIRAYREALELEPGNKIVKNKIAALTRPPKKVQVAKTPTQSAPAMSEKPVIKAASKADQGLASKLRVANLSQVGRYSNTPSSVGVTH